MSKSQGHGWLARGKVSAGFPAYLYWRWFVRCPFLVCGLLGGMQLKRFLQLHLVLCLVEVECDGEGHKQLYGVWRLYPD